MKRGAQFDTSPFRFLVAFLVNEFIFLNIKIFVREKIMKCECICLNLYTGQEYYVAE